VGFNEYGRYEGTEPYTQDERKRALVIKLAQEKATRLFRHETRSGDS